MFKTCDPDANGITRKEFLSSECSIAGGAAGLNMRRIEDSVLSQIFEILDTDKDGFVTKKEFKSTHRDYFSVLEYGN